MTTQTKAAATSTSAVSPPANTEILFVRDDGLFAVANIAAGKLNMTQSGDNAAENWTHVVPVGTEILFVRDDGLFAVANIAAGKLNMTQSGDNAAENWTHVIAS